MTESRTDSTSIWQTVGHSKVSQSKSSFGLQAFLPFALLAVLTLLAYLPALRGGFIWDDDAYVTQNSTLRDLNGLGHIWTQVNATPQYYPLVHTGFWLEYHLWGLRPAGYHAVNICLHALAAILLACVLRRLRVPGAWLAAAIFALHPIEVESVAWITERKNVLSAVFYFAAALAYFRFLALSEAKEPRGRQRLIYSLALLFFVAALLSKTVACSLPAALLLVQWWKQGRLHWKNVLALAPFFACGAALGLGTAWIEKHHVGASGMEWSLTFAQRCLIAGRAMWFYAGKLLWPVPLIFIYPLWNVDPHQSWQWLFPIAAIALVTALWLARRKWGRGPVVAALFFVVTLGPALGFVNIYPMRYSFVADHFQYLAGLGLIVPLAILLHRLPRAVPAALLLALGLLTWQRTLAYHDLPTLWRDTLAKNPDCWLAHNNLGLELEHAGRFDEALEQYLSARQSSPAFPETWNNLGNAIIREGHLDDATRYYRRAIQLRPAFADPWNSLGVIYGMEGNYDQAYVCLGAALRIEPCYARAHLNLGNLLKLQGHLDEADREYRTAAMIENGESILCGCNSASEDHQFE